MGEPLPRPAIEIAHSETKQKSDCNDGGAEEVGVAPINIKITNETVKEVGVTPPHINKTNELYFLIEIFT